MKEMQPSNSPSVTVLKQTHPKALSALRGLRLLCWVQSLGPGLEPRQQIMRPFVLSDSFPNQAMRLQTRYLRALPASCWILVILTEDPRPHIPHSGMKTIQCGKDGESCIGVHFTCHDSPQFCLQSDDA